MLEALITLAAVTPELSLDQLLVGTGALGIFFLLVKVFMTHLGKVDERHRKAFQELHRTHRDDIKTLWNEHVDERKESRDDHRRALREVIADLHPRLESIEGGMKETNKKLDDVGGHLAAMNRSKS